MVVNDLHDFGTKSSLLFFNNKAGKETTESQKPINIPIYLIQMHFKEQLQPPDISRSSKLALGSRVHGTMPWGKCHHRPKNLLHMQSKGEPIPFGNIKKTSISMCIKGPTPTGNKEK